MNRTWGVRFLSAIVVTGTLAATPLLRAQTSSSTPSSTDAIRVNPPVLPHVTMPDPALSPAELEQKGDDLRAEKVYFDALDYYRAALKKIPHSASLYNKAGICELQTQHYEEADKDFRHAIHYDKTFAISYNNLGVVEYKARKYSRALGYYEKAIKFDPDSASFYNNQGAAFFAERKFDKANDAYMKAMQLDPDIFERTSHSGVSAQLPSPEDRAHYDYAIAKLYARINASDRSLEYLRRAMEEGYKGINDVYKDDEFSNVRKDPRFAELMKQKPVAISD